jgi:hypothetical protein
MIISVWGRRGGDRMVGGYPKYLCNQCLSPLMLWARIPFWRGLFDTALCDKVCQWLATGRWFSQGTPVSFTINKAKPIWVFFYFPNVNPLTSNDMCNRATSGNIFILISLIYSSIAIQFNVTRCCKGHYWLVKLKFYDRHHYFANRNGVVCVTNDHGYVPFVVITIWSFPYSWPIIRFVKRLTRRVPHVE